MWQKPITQYSIGPSLAVFLMVSERIGNLYFQRTPQCIIKNIPYTHYSSYSYSYSFHNDISVLHEKLETFSMYSLSTSLSVILPLLRNQISHKSGHTRHLWYMQNASSVLQRPGAIIHLYSFPHQNINFSQVTMQFLT